MREQSLKDTGGGAPASHFQDLPMTIAGKGCYTVSGAKMAGPEQEGGTRWHENTNRKLISLLMKNAQNEGLMDFLLFCLENPDILEQPQEAVFEYLHRAAG